MALLRQGDKVICQLPNGSSSSFTVGMSGTTLQLNMFVDSCRSQGGIIRTVRGYAQKKGVTTKSSNMSGAVIEGFPNANLIDKEFSNFSSILEYPAGKTQYDNFSGEEHSNFRILGIGKPSAKQQKKIDERKENKETKKDAREDFRDEKKICRDKYGTGKDYRDCIKPAKQEKKETIKQAGGGLGHKLMKYNPATAAIRAGVLAGIRLNIFGLAAKLAPVVSGTNFKKKPSVSYKNHEEALKKIKELYYKIGGESKKIDEVVKQGYNKPVFKNAKSLKASGFDGIQLYSNVSGEELLLAGLPVLASMAAIAVKLIPDKDTILPPNTNPEDLMPPVLSDDQQQAINRAMQGAQEEKANGLPPDKRNDKQIIADPEGKIEKFLGMPKPLGIGVAVAGTGLLIWGIVELIKWGTKK